MSINFHGFTSRDGGLYRNLALNQLNELSLSEKPEVIVSALKTLLPDSNSESSASSIPSSLQDRVKALKELLDDPGSWVQDESRYADFCAVITDCVQEKIQALEKMTPEEQEKERQIQLLENHLNNKSREGLTKLLKPLQEKAAQKIQSTQDLVSFLEEEKKQGRIGGNWKLEVLYSHESVITHYLYLKKYVTREEILSLTVDELISYGHPDKEEGYQQLRTDSNAYVGINAIKLVNEREKIIKYINELSEKDAEAHLISFMNSQPDYLKNDRKILLVALRRDGRLFSEAPDELKSNRELVIELIKKDGDLLQYASENLKNDPELISIAERSIVIKTINKTAADRVIDYFLSLDNRFKNDREIALKLVSKNGKALEVLSRDLQVDAQIALAAELTPLLEEIRKLSKEKVIAFARRLPPKFKNNREVALELVKKNGLALQVFPEKVVFNSPYLKFLEPFWNCAPTFISGFKNLRNDLEVVSAAVKENGLALKYASEKLKSDFKIVQKAALQNSSSFQYASQSIKSNSDDVFDIVSAYVKFNYNYENLRQSDEYRANFDRYEAQHSNDPFQYASEDLRSNKAAVYLIVCVDGLALRYASDSLKNDFMIVSAAIQQNGLAIKHASDAMKDDPELALIAVERDLEAYKYISPNCQQDPRIQLVVGL